MMLLLTKPETSAEPKRSLPTHQSNVMLIPDHANRHNKLEGRVLFVRLVEKLAAHP